MDIHPQQVAPVRVAANRTVTKRLGNWTTARHLELRAHRGVAVLDLRSPHIAPGDLHVHLDLDHATTKLLVADDAVIDDWDLRRVGRGGVKDAAAPQAGAGRRIVLTGELRNAEIRVQRAGVAVWSAIWSREFFADARRAHAHGGTPSVADPAHTR